MSHETASHRNHTTYHCDKSYNESAAILNSITNKLSLLAEKPTLSKANNTALT